MATDAPITAPSENDAPTPLYRLFEEYPHVVQTHILTKLKRNERKFLCDAKDRGLGFSKFKEREIRHTKKAPAHSPRVRD